MKRRGPSDLTRSLWIMDDAAKAAELPVSDAEFALLASLYEEAAASVVTASEAIYLPNARYGRVIR